MNPPDDVSAQQAETKAKVRSALQDVLALIDSPERAEAVLADLEKATAGQTEEQQAVEAARQPDDAAQRVAESVHADDRPKTERAADALMSVAAEAVAPTSEAPAVVEGAREAVGTGDQGSLADESQRLRTGRKHLKDAALRRMAPVQALDARIFLTVNQSPHPRWLDRLADWLAVTANGGWLWVIGASAAGIAGAPRTARVLVALVPAVATTALVIEYPVKTVFRRAGDRLSTSCARWWWARSPARGPSRAGIRRPRSPPR